MAASTRRWGIPIPELKLDNGSTVRELRPMRSCRTLFVAFLPVRHPADVIRYCVTAREVDESTGVASGACASAPRTDIARARIHCADHPARIHAKVITERISGLQPGQRYAIAVTASVDSGPPVQYSVIYAHTTAYCKGE